MWCSQSCWTELLALVCTPQRNLQELDQAKYLCVKPGHKYIAIWNETRTCRRRRVSFLFPLKVAVPIERFFPLLSHVWRTVASDKQASNFFLLWKYYTCGCLTLRFSFTVLWYLSSTGAHYSSCQIWLHARHFGWSTEMFFIADAVASVA